MDLVIKNGLVVSPLATFKADIGIWKGRISTIAENLPVSDGTRSIDVTGKYVLPGAIDVHTHMEHWSGPQRTADDFESGTKAAACGGVTTIIDFAIQRKEESPQDAVASKRALADPKVAIDYSLHPCLTDVNEKTGPAIRHLVEAGYPSFKLFMTFRKEGFMVDDGALFALLEVARDCGALIGVHAENSAILEYLIERLIREGKTTPEYHPRSRPNLVEAECISRAIMLARAAGSRLYVFHMSTRQGAEAVIRARNEGVGIFAETCPHYLILTDEEYARPDGQNFIMSPPLRKSEDREALWDALHCGYVDIVSSDHCGFTQEQKEPGRRSFAEVAPGIPGVETLLPVLYSEGVSKGRITINRLVEVLCHNPAKLFGLPRKGSVQVGNDADLVVLDPAREVVLSSGMLNMASGYTPFEGMKLKGYPEVTILRGEVVSQNGRFTGQTGFGRFVPRVLN